MLAEENTMNVQLAQQVQELLGTRELVIITERVDDVALLMGQMVTMGFVAVLARPLPRHWKQRQRSWGWTAVIWLAYLLTEGAHRQGSVAASINGMQRPLSGLRGQVIDPLDVNDARLSHLWQHWSRPRYGHESEQDWHARSLAVYDLSSEASRCDATTGSGEHAVTDGGLGPFGHSKEAPSRPQRKVMTGS